MTASHCVYFEQAAGGIKLGVTTAVDRVVGRLNRASRRASATSSTIIAAVPADKDRASKLRRVISRAWSGQHRGGGVFTVSPAEVRVIADHLADKFDMVVYGADRPLSGAATNLVVQHFARGKRSKWTPPDDKHDDVLSELLAAGAITKHRGGLYCGSERSAALVRRAAQSRVPARGKPSMVVSNTPIIGEAVVPEPRMPRELLIARMEEAADSGLDPHDVLHRDAYRGALVNLREQLGGYAVLELDEFQRRGVAEFRQTGEEGQLGGAKAIDYEVTRVDSSLVNTVTEAGALARAQHSSACEMLKAPRHGEDEDDRRPGLVRVAVAERLAIRGQSLREVSIALGMGAGGAARERTKAIAMGVATDLARHFGFLRGGRSPLRHDGNRPSDLPAAMRTEITVKKGRKREKA